jgi:dolichyl-diphosphooligosaccharide--protein glycosyltransferase
MRSHAAERGWEYPESYVFSRWGDNRAYNWFVSGESQYYRYAFNHFREFVDSGEWADWYARLVAENRDGFVVVSAADTADSPDGSLGRELFARWGAQTGHYRALWTDASGDLKVYSLVPGATVTGPGEPGESVSLSLQADVGEQTVERDRTATVNEHGVYMTTVPLPGDGDDGVTITPADVEAGAVVSGFDGQGTAAWSFEEGAGEWIYDRVGGRHGAVVGARWETAEVGGTTRPALRFDGTESWAELLEPVSLDEGWSIDLSVRSASADNWQFLLGAHSTSPCLFLHKETYLVYKTPEGEHVLWNVGPYEDELLEVTLTAEGDTLTLERDGDVLGTRSSVQTGLRVDSIGGVAEDWSQWKFDGDVYGITVR